MSNIIRSLLVKVGVDLADMQKNLLKAGKDLKAMGKSLTTTGTSLTKGLTVPILGGVAAVGALMVKSGQAADELLTLSAKFGLTTDAIQEMQYAARFVDVEFETMAGSMQKLTKSMDAARKGTKEQVDAFKELGIEYQNSDGSLRDAKQVWLEAIDALNGVSNEADRDALALKLFGKSAVELNPLIKAGSKELNKLAQEAHSVGAVMSKDNVSALGKFDDAMQKITAVVKTAGGQLAVAFLPIMEKLKPVIEKTIIPAIKKLAEFIGNLIKGFNNLSPQLKGLILTFGGLAVAVGPVMTMVGKLTTGIGGMATALGKTIGAISGGKGIIASFTAFTSSAGLVVAALAAIAGVVALVISSITFADEETQQITRDTNDLIKSMKDSANSFKNNIDEINGSSLAAERLTSRLEELTNKTNLTAAEQRQMESIVAQLNDIYPELGLEIDGVTGNLNKGITAIRDTIKAQKDLAIASAYQERTKVLAKELVDVQVKLKDIEDKRLKNSQKITEAERAKNEAYKNFQSTMDKLQKSNMQSYEKEQLLIEASRERKRVTDAADRTIEEAIASNNSLESSQASLYYQMYKTNEEIDNNISSFNDLQSAIKRTADQMRKSAEPASGQDLLDLYYDMGIGMGGALIGGMDQTLEGIQRKARELATASKPGTTSKQRYDADLGRYVSYGVGGYVNKPHLAMVGDEEEVIIPLNNKKRSLELLSLANERLGKYMQPSVKTPSEKQVSGVTQLQSQTIIIPVNLDGREIARVTTPYIDKNLQKTATAYGRGGGK